MSLPSETTRCQEEDCCRNPPGAECNRMGGPCCPIPNQFKDYSNSCCNQCPKVQDEDVTICNLPQPGPPYVFNNVDCTLDCSPVDTSELEWFKPNVAKYGLLRHTMDDMRCVTMAKENAAADLYNEAECTRYEGKRIYDYAHEKTGCMQKHTTQRLKNRSVDIYCWMKQLERWIYEMREQSRILQELRYRAENVLRAVTDIILHVVNECLRRRLSRIGIDLIRDDLEEELQKERDVALVAQKRLEDLIAQTRDQIGKNRAAKERLERDWSDKVEAFRIDDLNHRLGPLDPTILYHPGAARFGQAMTTPEEWEEMVCRNIQEAECESSASCGLRHLIPDLLKSMACKLRAQADNVEAALGRRIQETEEMKCRLEHQLRLVLDEIVKVEKTMAEFQCALHGHPIETGLQLAQTRLYNRSYRPNVENVRDCPQYSLVEEVRQIGLSQSAIEAQLRNAADSLHKLRQVRIDLEKEIAVKDNTLVIDRERVAYVRAFWPSLTTLVGW